MIRFGQEKVLLMHQLIAQETGGDAGVRDQVCMLCLPFLK